MRACWLGRDRSTRRGWEAATRHFLVMKLFAYTNAGVGAVEAAFVVQRGAGASLNRKLLSPHLPGPQPISSPSSPARTATD